MHCHLFQPPSFFLHFFFYTLLLADFFKLWRAFVRLKVIVGGHRPTHAPSGTFFCLSPCGSVQSKSLRRPRTTQFSLPFFFMLTFNRPNLVIKFINRVYFAKYTTLHKSGFLYFTLHYMFQLVAIIPAKLVASIVRVLLSSNSCPRPVVIPTTFSRTLLT